MTSLSSKYKDPSSIFIILPKALAKVVLPQPTGPTKATISPGFILNEISSSIFLGESS